MSDRLLDIFSALSSGILLDFFFFFNVTATTEIYTLSLHDALPISRRGLTERLLARVQATRVPRIAREQRSEEHTSELQSLTNLVCRLLLEKKNININDKNKEHPIIDHEFVAHNDLTQRLVTLQSKE